MKKFAKLLAAACAVIFSVTVCFGCAKDKGLSVYAPMGATALVFAQMAYEASDFVVTKNGKDTVYDADYRFVAADANTPDNITAAVKTGKADIALLPVNAAAALLGKGGDQNPYADKYKIVSVNTHGNLFMLRKGSVAFEDVKKVAVKNLGAVPGLTYKAILGKDCYTQNESAASAATPFLKNIGDGDTPPAFLTAQGFDAIVMPEPAATTIMNTPVAAQLHLQKTSLQDLWGDKFGTDHRYAQAVMVVRKSLATEEFVDALLKKTEESAAWLGETDADGTLKNRDAVISALTSCNVNNVLIPFKADNFTPDCLTGCNIFVEKGASVKTSVLSYLNKIKDVGAEIKMPSDEFFYSV